jgi:hypothetical protein
MYDTNTTASKQFILRHVLVMQQHGYCINYSFFINRDEYVLTWEDALESFSNDIELLDRKSSYE